MHKDRARGRPFERVLIANRGEIAVRIIRACRDLGIATVAVFSDADSTSPHVRFADEAVRLGPAPAAESYLRGDAIVAAALATGAEAIHPGYGFLAERASFARLVEGAGLVFVGPSSAAIAALGDKLAARRSAAAVDVPVVPGTLEPAPVDRPDQVDRIAAQAREIGFPLFVKAAAGGGGRGMRRVDRVEDLPAALASGSAEAAAAFGDGTVYLERLIGPARHVEVQLIGDRSGRVVALGERDCSLQRRNQKLVEESPAPGLSPGERRALHDHAVRAATAAGLENAATAEFLVDEDRRPWFLEVNTRLQVEHGVTELVADVDLVREQLFVAAGEPLSEAILAAAARATEPPRHAIEVRLSAEDPARGFAPAPGRVGRWSMPSGPGVRVDAAIEPGSRVPADYDPLIAKVLVVDDARDGAIDRLRRALDEVEVTGIQTTLPFHRFVARHPGFRAGDLAIDWVAREWEPVVEADRAQALEAAAWVAAAVAAGGEGSPAGGEGSSAGGEGSSVGRSARPSSAGAADPSPNGTGPTDPAAAWRRAGRLAAADRWPR
ncbi:MAG TPA: biotin carboxylase N-terminal domain-containing protein [Candidatus Limnocylindrales bacterium]|nr:biotin carboxylase N-terminal domain-containing protein [Candidatus Limnocylindrales bacterium]